MAIDSSVYSGSQFKLYIAEQALLGTANTTAGEFVVLDVTSVSDIDYSGIAQDRTMRTGQQVMRPSDNYVSEKGAVYSMNFEWVISHQEGFEMLLAGVTEDAASPYGVTGDFTPPVYTHGAGTGKFYTVIISSPAANEDRLMHSAVLSNLSIVADSASDGGRIKVSGTLFTGYKPTVAANAIVPSGTETVFIPLICEASTTKQYAGADLVLKSYQFDFTYPASRLGWQGADCEPESYSRSGAYVLGGSFVAKWDANSQPAEGNFKDGSVAALLFSGTSLSISVPQAEVLPFQPDFAPNDDGVFSTIPFSGTALDSQDLFVITIT